MVEIRVSGDKNQVDQVVERLRSCDSWSVTSVSKSYPNRDGGVRVYVDLDIDEPLII